MKKREKQQSVVGLQISSSPQIYHSDSTAKIMWTVFGVLLLPTIWGVFVFGASALFILILTTLTGVGAELLINLKTKKNTIKDGSAAVTGLLVGMNMPPSMPWFIPVLATLFAILIVKWTFGGLGKNWANPAIAGRIFVFLSYSREMMTWKLPSMPWKQNFFVDGATGATPLGMLKEGSASLADFETSGAVIKGPTDLIGQMVEENGYQISSFDIKITDWFNSWLGSSWSPGNFDPFFGLIPGSIGEVSALLLIIGGLILLAKKIITWEIPVAFIGSFVLLVWLFGGLRYDQGFFTGQPWYQVMTGGLLLGALFMATDMVTSPATRMGMLIFGIGCGLLTFLVRFLGNFPEGVSLAILFMNILTPLLDRYIKPKKFGFIKVKKERGVV